MRYGGIFMKTDRVFIECVQPDVELKRIAEQKKVDMRV